MKAKFMFSLICVAAVTLTACEEYPYGYYSHGSSPYGYYSPYGYGGYGYPTVAVAIGGNGYYGGYGYGGNRYYGNGYYGGNRSYSGNRYYGNRSYGGHRRHPYYHRGQWEDQGDQRH